MNELGEKITFLVNDTIGFIDNLPPDLIQAFRSTLEESIYADMLLHVIDASDLYFERKIQIVDQILTQIEPTSIQHLVFNKIDNLTNEQVESLKVQYPTAFFVSAITKNGINQLVSFVINQALEQQLPDDLRKEI